MDKVSGQKINAGLKWPNDLLINKKKICGILIESEINGDNVEFIVGIGINYSLPKKESWWGEIGELADILPREKLINSILQSIIHYSENGYMDWKDAWEKRCMHMGIKLEAVSNNQKNIELGIFNGINEEGKMLLQTKNELKIISSGECSIKGYIKLMLHTIFNTEIAHNQSTEINSIIFGAGCFWGVERKFWSLSGVVMTSVGYSGGDHESPTYELVCSGITGHAEVVRIDYDPAKISLLDLLKVFWECHDLDAKQQKVRQSLAMTLELNIDLFVIVVL